MARLVYASRFEIPAAEGLDPASAAYRDWLIGHYRERRQLANFTFDPTRSLQLSDLPEGHSLSSKFYSSVKGLACRIQWSFPDNTNNGLRWSNDIRIGRFGDRCTVEHQILIESVEYSIAPARLLVGSPRVVRDICTKTLAYVGDMQVRATPYLLQQNGLGDFLKLLCSKRRRLPIALLSSYARGEANLVDAGQLARNLAGVAVVVQATEPEVTWEFADEVGRQLSCFNGAARIYWPGFSRDDDPHSHRLFLGARIEQTSPTSVRQAIERAVFAVAAFRFVPDERISDVIRAVEAAERQKQLEEKRSAGDDFWEDYERDLARLEEATKRIGALEKENANLRANQKVLFTGVLSPTELDDDTNDEPPTITSVKDAVEKAAKRACNIELLLTAYSSAKESPFQRPFDIFEALMDLDAVVEAWRKQRDEKGSGGDLLQHLRDRGWGKRSSMHISDTTKGKFRSYYEFTYDGVRQLFEPHITIGSGDPNSCASIHFIFDQRRERIIVAHVGKHLPNTKT